MTVNYEELRRIELSEKKSAQLYKLPQDFYIDASRYLKQLQLSYDSLKQGGGDEGTRKLSMLGDQISNARESVRSIYEIREKKMVTLAISASRGVMLDLGALSPDEKRIYGRILGVMREARDELLFCRRTEKVPDAPLPVQKPAPAPPAQKFPDAVPRVSANAPAHPAGADPLLSAASGGTKVAIDVGDLPELSEGSALPTSTFRHHTSDAAPSQPDSTKAAGRTGAANYDYVTVRVMDEMPQFIGNDGLKYSLRKGDVATLHKANAAILERHGKVEAIV